MGPKIVSPDEMLAECLGWSLSRALGVPTPSCAVYLLGPRGSFLSEVITDVVHWDDTRPQAMRNPGDLGAILALDSIIANGDRNDGNLLFKPNAEALDVYSIDLANAFIGSPTLFAELKADAPGVGTLVRGIPLALVSDGAMACALRAQALPESLIDRNVRSACRVSGYADLRVLSDTLKLRCANAPEIVSKYLKLVANIP